MGFNQFQVSIDKDYEHFFNVVHRHDASYTSPKTNGPCRKRIVQDAVRLFAMLKTRQIQCINMFIYEACPRRPRIDNAGAVDREWGLWTGRIL